MSISHNNSVQSMDIFSKKKTHSDGAIKETKKTEKLPAVTEHGFITAAKKSDLSTLQSLLSNPHFDPNVQNEWGCTALMFATINRDRKVIDLLFKDYRLDTTRQNSDGRFAHSYLQCDNEKDETIDHKKFFARFSLDSIVNKYAFNMKKDYHEGKIPIAILTIRAQEILKKVKKSETDQQSDCEIPEEALCKTDIEEILKMLNFRLVLPNK